MPQLDKFKVAVIVDGDALPEYSVAITEASKAVACWIPSQEGKPFNINFEAEAHRKALKVAVMIDGEWIQATSLYPKDILQSVQFAHFLTSPTTCRELLFGRIELTDDDTFLNANVKGLGEISLSVWEGTIGGASSSKGTYKVPEKKVHERSKKALGHQVKFGKEKVIAPPSYKSFTQGELLATFIFKYRSIDILQADGIAPPDPAANKRKVDGIIDDESESEVEDENQDQGEDDERQLKVLLEQVNKIQGKLAKKVSKETRSKKKMKKEPRPLLLSGEVIDLT